MPISRKVPGPGVLRNTAKLAGVLSEGMLVCAEDAEGNLALMTPEKAMPSGAEIC